MRPRHVGWFLVVAAVLVTGAQQAAAQLTSRQGAGLTFRPSDNSPSASVGGRTTSGTTRALGTINRNVSLLGGNEFQVNRRRASATGEVLPVSQFGLSGVMTGPRGVPLSQQLARTGEIAVLSGILVTTDLINPIPGYDYSMPSIDAFRFTPQPTQTPHETFFELQPVLVAPAEGEPVYRITSYHEAIESHTQWRVAVMERDALDAFRRGTIEGRDATTGRYPSCATCTADLNTAWQKLQVVRSLQDDNALAPLVLMHLSLERERPTQATVFLLDAYLRDPEGFLSDPDGLDKLYGDAANAPDGRSPLLRAQLQRFVRIGELNPESSEAALVEAYCAWRLGDRARMRESTARIAKIAADRRDIRVEAVRLAEAIAAKVP